MLRQNIGENKFLHTEDSPKWVKAKDGEKRPNDGNNNGQAMHGARMAHASRLGQFTKYINCRFVYFLTWWQAAHLEAHSCPIFTVFQNVIV